MASVNNMTRHHSCHRPDCTRTLRQQVWKRFHHSFGVPCVAGASFLTFFAAKKLISFHPGCKASFFNIRRFPSLPEPPFFANLTRPETFTKSGDLEVTEFKELAESRDSISLEILMFGIRRGCFCRWKHETILVYIYIYIAIGEILWGVFFVLRDFTDEQSPRSK